MTERDKEEVKDEIRRLQEIQAERFADKLFDGSDDTHYRIEELKDYLKRNE